MHRFRRTFVSRALSERLCTRFLCSDLTFANPRGNSQLCGATDDPPLPVSWLAEEKSVLFRTMKSLNKMI